MKKSIALKFCAVSLLLALCLGLSGCANLTKEDITPAGLTVVNKHLETVLVNLTRNRKFDPRHCDEHRAVQDAIVNSIIQSGLFSRVVTTSNADYQLDVRLLDGTMDLNAHHTSSTPASFACTTRAVWELTRMQDHKLVYKDDITTGEHVTEVWHGIYGTIHVYDGIAGSVRKNIQLAIERMGNVKEFGELQVQSLDQSQPNPTVANTGGAQTLGTTPASNVGGSNYSLKTDPAAEAAFPDVARKYRETPVKPELSEEAHKCAVQGDFAIEKKNLPVAIDRYTDALKIAPWWPEGYLKRGRLLAEIELYDAAIADMKKFLLLAPEAKEAREAQDNIYKWESAGTLTASKGQSLMPATTASTTGPSLKPGEAIPANKALVYIYRLAGGQLWPAKLSTNGRVLTTIVYSTYYPYLADPGTIEFTEEGGPLHCTFTLNVTAGQTYYLKSTTYTASYFPIMKPGVKLEQVSAEIGANDIKSCVRKVKLDQTK